MRSPLAVDVRCFPFMMGCFLSSLDTDKPTFDTFLSMMGSFVSSLDTDNATFDAFLSMMGSFLLNFDFDDDRKNDLV